jgi:hypothetical protein
MPFILGDEHLICSTDWFLLIKKHTPAVQICWLAFEFIRVSKMCLNFPRKPVRSVHQWTGVQIFWFAGRARFGPSVLSAQADCLHPNLWWSTVSVQDQSRAVIISFISYLCVVYSTFIMIIKHQKYSDIQKSTIGSNWTTAVQYHWNVGNRAWQNELYKMPIRKSMEYSHESGQRNWSYYIHVYGQHPNWERNAVNKSFINLCLKEHLNVLAVC